MTHQYNIEGFKCSGCVARAKSALLSLGDITEAEVQLATPQATITMLRHIPTTTLQDALQKAGQFSISEANVHMGKNSMASTPMELPASWLSTYKPILILGAFLVGGTLLLETSYASFSLERAMQHYMAAFFLTFSFFKLLDVKAFAESYSSYDVLARRWPAWGLAYPFVELLLGLAYLINFQPLLTNGVTFAIMGISIIGVIQSVLSRKKIRCACLGTVFNLPMSTITIIENALMILMSAIMLLKLI